MNHQEYKKSFLGKGVQEGLGFQCVAQVKHYAKQVFGETLGTFGGSAIQGWRSGDPFNNKWKRQDYKKGIYPRTGDIVFFDLGTKYGHVAVVDEGTNQDTLKVVEQNMGNGDGKGDDDKIKLGKYTYKNVLGWFSYTKEESPQVKRAIELGITNGENLDGVCTRREAIIMNMRLLEKVEAMIK